MARPKLVGPVLIAVAGFLVFASWFVGMLPLMTLPLPHPANTELRRFLFGKLLPFVGGAMLLGGSVSGLRRRRAAGRSWASIGSATFGVAAVAGALVLTFLIYLFWD